MSHPELGMAVLDMMDADTETLRRTVEALTAELARQRRALLHLSEITGAGAAVLDAIHRSGGYQVADPTLQDKMQTAMQALENAVVAALAGRMTVNAEVTGGPLAARPVD